jgi:transcriptional regulator with XRE-family HTH domain
LIRLHREKRGFSRKELADKLGIPVTDLESIENGGTSLEIYAPLLLSFAEIIDQPIFNLFYPCGLPLEKLTDYP